MSAGETHAELSEDGLGQCCSQPNPDHPISRTRRHSTGSVSAPTNSIASSLPEAVADNGHMNGSVVMPHGSDILPSTHVVKFKPCLVLRPSSSSSPRSPVARFAGHPPSASFVDPSGDLVTNGCLSDPLPISEATVGASLLKPCRSLGRSQRSGFSSPPLPSCLPPTISYGPRRRHSHIELMKSRASQSRSPPPPANVVRAIDMDAVHALLLGDDDEDETEDGDNQRVRDNTSYSNDRDARPNSGSQVVQPLGQAVVAALKHHHLFRSTNTTTTTSTASSRFSPGYLSDENDGDGQEAVGAGRPEEDEAAQEADSDTDGVSYDDDSTDINPNVDGQRRTRSFPQTAESGVEPDVESGYGASCSSSSIRLSRFGSRRDKRRSKRRAQRQNSVGTSTAETHSSPGDEEEEEIEEVHTESSGLAMGVLNDITDRHTPRNSSLLVAAATTANELGDLGSSVSRRIASSRTASCRHKRNRVRILDDDDDEQHEQQQRQDKSRGVRGNRHQTRMEGSYSCGEATQANDDRLESPRLAHRHTSFPSYPCSTHRYSIDTGSAPSILTSDTEANHPESDAFGAMVENSPVPNLSRTGLAPGAAMPPPPNAVPTASILIVPTNSQTYNSTFSPFTSVPSSGRCCTSSNWHPDPSHNSTHFGTFQTDPHLDSTVCNTAGSSSTHAAQHYLCSVPREAHHNWWESSNCSWYEGSSAVNPPGINPVGPAEISSAFHPASFFGHPYSHSTRPIRRASANPLSTCLHSVHPVGWHQWPNCSHTNHSAPHTTCPHRALPPTCLVHTTPNPVACCPASSYGEAGSPSEPCTNPSESNRGPAGALMDSRGGSSLHESGDSYHHPSAAWCMSMHMPFQSRTSPGSVRSQRLGESGRSRSAMEQRRYSAPCDPMYEVNLASSINPLSHTPGPTRVSLVVDNVRFIVDAQILQAHPDTMLGRMISSQFSESTRLSEACQSNDKRDPQNEEDISTSNSATHYSDAVRRHPPDILVAQNSSISAHLFRAILDYYLLGHMYCPPGVTVQELKEICDYFLIPFNHHTVRCNNLRAFLHELSNDGARANFARFLEMHILSLLVKCAQTGERECHVVIVTDDETIVWDPDFPPQMPENELQSHIIYSTQMFRFLKYIENREVAKQVLLERGLKKIRIGIEGYPTCKDRMKFRPGLRPEAIYNYVQCPFLRMSWEEEENKSRHVDFQCVKSKSVSDLTTGLEQAVVDPLPPHLIRSPLRLSTSSPDRADLGSASFAVQVNSLDPDGPLVLEGIASSPRMDALDDFTSPREPDPPQALTDSPVITEAPPEEPERLISSSARDTFCHPDTAP